MDGIRRSPTAAADKRTGDSARRGRDARKSAIEGTIRAEYARPVKLPSRAFRGLVEQQEVRHISFLQMDADGRTLRSLKGLSPLDCAST